jgi:hypothetical protein
MKLIIPKSKPTENGFEMMGKSWRESCARLWSLVLHDLQGLGSLTTIWVHFSDTWDTPEQLALELDILSNNNHSDDEEGKRYYVYFNPAASQLG